jgi:hypothetical protein
MVSSRSSGHSPGCPAGLLRLAAEGAYVAAAVGDGARLIDVSTPTAPTLLESWTSPDGAQNSIAMMGLFVLSGSQSKATLLDATGHLARRTWAPTNGGRVSFANGVAIVGDHPTRILDLPYPWRPARARCLAARWPQAPRCR